jgi:hypothetical protein
MPKQTTVERAREAKRKHNSPSTQAGAFVHEEIEHIREGKHGARSTEQAIAIGLSKARRAGVKLPPPKKGTTSESTRRAAQRDLEKGQGGRIRKTETTGARSRASLRRLKREPHQAALPAQLSQHARRAARRSARRLPRK